MANRREALLYHSLSPAGKIAIVPTKPCETARDLALAYSPGVAEPCREIDANQDTVYTYTNKGNLVAVISNGTAVLGLGNIGPHAAKPVMEGKAVLFKTFADVDVFDVELDCKTADQVIETVVALAPTFGGINLEDIKAPECFYIEDELKRRLDIPVFHDDQHGTAIIGGAALKNALELVKKDIKEIRLVISGAGAAAIACARLLVSMGIAKGNLIMCDSKGVIYKGRTEGMNPFKQEFALETNCRTLAEAMVGADVFFGVSSAGLVTQQMIKSMADKPIVFAMANPDPEISYPEAKAARPDVIVATGRSDFPNQVNNVLGFPFIFRGALDVRARGINEAMKMAAVEALACLAREPVPESVQRAYENKDISFGPEYLIPKPFDPRVLYYVAPAVARAAMDTGLARQTIDLAEYTLRLKAKQNHGRVVLRRYYNLARSSKRKKIVYMEGASDRVLKAVQMVYQEGIAEPILLGQKKLIVEEALKLDLDLDRFSIIEPSQDNRYQTFAQKFYQAKCRNGITETEALHLMAKEHYFGPMLLAQGEVDGAIGGVGRYYPDVVKPILSIVGLREGCKTAAGLYIVSIRDRLLFFADTSINIEMNSAKLAEIAIMSAELAESMDVVPRIAMLSFSTFGSVKHPLARMVQEATEIVQTKLPELQIDGEMQADAASDYFILKENYPFSSLKAAANVFVFPDMQSGNIAYKLLQRLGGARVIGPIILGVKSPAHVMQQHASVDEIFNMTTVAVAQAALGQKHALKIQNKLLVNQG